MSFPTQFTLIPQTSAKTTQSTAVNLGAICNKWAVQVVGEGLGSLTLNFTCSCDGTNYATAAPAATRGQWFTFDVPAQYVIATLAGNTGTVALYVVAEGD